MFTFNSLFEIKKPFVVDIYLRNLKIKYDYENNCVYGIPMLNLINNYIQDVIVIELKIILRPP